MADQPTCGKGLSIRQELLELLHRTAEREEKILASMRGQPAAWK